MKSEIKLDISELVNAITKLQNEVMDLKKILSKGNFSNTTKASYRKPGPKQNAKFNNTVYPVRILKFGFNVNVVPRENKNYRGKSATHPREFIGDYSEFPIVLGASLTLNFKDQLDTLKTITVSSPRELIKSREECLKYLNNVYNVLFEIQKDAVRNISDGGRVIFNLKEFKTENVIDTIEEKRIELNQL